MKKVLIDENILYKWINDFIKSKGYSPTLRDFYKYNGSPYGKSVILKQYGSLTNLYKKLNINLKELGYGNITNEELLSKLKEYVLMYRTTDRDILRNKGLYDRSVYENRFGSWSKALAMCGINNTVKTLIKYFDDYNGEDYIQYIKNKIGCNGDFTQKQYEIINRIKDIANTCGDVRKLVNYFSIRKYFITASILLIACGKEPTVNYCSGNKYISFDGHICDSGKEVVIDNFLYNNNYEHDIHGYYPNSTLKYDFKVRDLYIEYAGLMDKKKYRDKIDKKIKFCKENNIKLLILYNTKNNDLEKLRAALESDFY